MPARKKEGEINWSPDLAYVVGLLTTDGNLSSDGRHISFISNDLALVQTLCSSLNLENRIGVKTSGFTGKKDSYRVQFCNIVLYRWLLSIGLMPNKSKKLGSLKVPDIYFFDFLRGHLDGDGTVRRYYDPIYRQSLRVYLTFLSASIEHLVWLQERILFLKHLSASIGLGARVYRLTYAKKASLEILGEMYRNPSAPRLQRKYASIQDLL